MSTSRVQDLKPRNIKAPLHLVPVSLLEATAAALHDGASKYEAWNWLDQGDCDDFRDTYTAAALRHLHAFADPTKSDTDEDSGLSHLCHAAACLAILTSLMGVGYSASTAVKDAEKGVADDAALSEMDDELAELDVEIRTRQLQDVVSAYITATARGYPIG